MAKCATQSECSSTQISVEVSRLVSVKWSINLRQRRQLISLSPPLSSHQVSPPQVHVQFIHVQDFGNFRPFHTGIHSGRNHKTRRRSTDSGPFAHKCLELAEFVGKIHLHRMEIPQQKYHEIDRFDVAGWQGEIQHRHTVIGMGRVLCQSDNGRSAIFEQGTEQDIGGSQRKGYSVSCAGCFLVVLLVCLTIPFFCRLMILHLLLQALIYGGIWWATASALGMSFTKTGMVVPISYLLFSFFWKFSGELQSVESPVLIGMKKYNFESSILPLLCKFVIKKIVQKKTPWKF